MKTNAKAAAILVGTGLILGIFLSYYFSPENGAKANEKIGADKAPAQMSEAAKALNQAFVETSQAVLPTVVSIKVEIERESRSQFLDEWHNFFKFFGESPFRFKEEPRSYKSFATGSGVIVSNDGYIVTNNHVVEDADEIEVTTFDKKKHKAKLIGRDPYTDLALIKIDAKNLPVAHLANIEDVKVGEFVLAIGNPLGLNSTVTSGIVSAIGRGGLALPNLSKTGGYAVENFIQTDAAINPGNSGGGLFDLNGSLVGINTAIATQTGTYIGYGFAIPVDLVKSVVADLIEDGKIDRGYIGVRIRSIDETDAKAIGLDKVEGVMIHDVVKGSAAEEAGLEPGDAILAVDGQPVKTSNELQSVIVKHRAGDKIELTIWRDKKKIKKTVVLKPKSDEEGESYADKNKEIKENARGEVVFEKLGFKVSPLTDELKDRLDVDYGAYISDVERYGQAADRGMSPGGVIVKADGKKIKSPKDLRRIIEKKKPGDGILLFVKYSDSNRIVALEIPEDDDK